MWDSLVITVGSYAFEGNASSFSNIPCDTCAQFVDVVAPGSFVVSTNRTNGYADFSGTSFATPIVAGVIAMARNVHPSIPPGVLEEMLKQTTDGGMESAGMTDDLRRLGHGRLNARRFMEVVVNTSMPMEATLTSLSIDTIQYLIITHDSLRTAFLTLADRKTSRGIPTALETIDSISVNYSGGDMQEKVRACIKDYKDNHGTKWVLLGGDETVVPARYAYNNLYGPGVRFISDYYYTCLDGDWNYDSDTLWGEVEDQVDMTPDVAVGRLPVTNSSQISCYIAKLADYEDGPSASWRTNVTAIGSKMFTSGDGKRMSEELLDEFPLNFTATELYDDSAGTSSLSAYFDAMNQGQGILLKHGMAHNHGGNFFLRRADTWTLLQWDNVDTLSNHSMPGLVYSATCFNHQIDSNCLAEHYINHPTGGAIAYIGTSHMDYVYLSQRMAVTFFDRLFGAGPKDVGTLLNESKQVILPDAEWDGAYRHLLFGYMLSGDPSLQIWTDTGAVLSDSTATTLDIIDSVVTVKITSLGSPIEGAVVCIWKQEDFYDDSYSVGLTDANGLVTFDNLSFRSGGFATVVATKHNYIAAQDTIFMTCVCRNRTGNVNYDRNDNCDLSDLIYLNNYLFSGGPEPPCMDEADVNGDSDVDLSDAIYLVNYLYDGGPDPVQCQ